MASVVTHQTLQLVKGKIIKSHQDGESFIMNKSTGEYLPLKHNGRGSYLLRVQFVGGGFADIIIDSGAEENVCPYEWGNVYGLDRENKKNLITCSSFLYWFKLCPT